MTTDLHPTSASAESFFEEHRELAEVLQQVDHILKRHDRARDQVEQQLRKLADLVESHFAHEEDGGYMADALARTPRLVSAAERLLTEHADLLDDAQKLQMLARSGVETESWWRQIETDFTKLKGRLLDHEHAENKLMHEAFNRDIGVAD